MRDTLSTLWRAFGRYRWHVVLLVAFGILSALFEGIGINAVVPLMSFFMGGDGSATDAISKIIQSLFSLLHIPFTFRYLLGFILILFILRAISVVTFGYVRGWIAADFLDKESEDMLRRTMLATWPFLLQQKIGTVHNTLVRDIQNTGALLSTVAQAVQSFSGLLMYLLVAVNISPTMTLYAIGGGAVIFVMVRPFRRHTRTLGWSAATVEKQFAQFLNEHISGMKTVKAAGTERAALKDGTSHIRALRALSIRLAFVSSASSSFFQPASLVLVIILFLLTYSAPGFSIISFAAGLYLIQKIFTYLESGQNALLSINQYVPYAKNVAAFKKELMDHRESVGSGDRPFVFEKSLAFDQVTFSYVESRPVLSDVSFSIARGEMIGLIGPSGAGKTSVADLVLRLFHPTSGAVLLDGVPAEEIPLDMWRKRISYVPQDVFLLNDTISENIRFYGPAISHEELEQVARQANIYDVVTSLPNGFNTVVGDRGALLSGGQRQRIALARALARKPEILILDEATSALDHESEKLIQESINALRGKVTVLIIAHRPSTVADADSIIVLRDGVIAEQGAPKNLLNDSSSYFHKMQHA